MNPRTVLIVDDQAFIRQMMRRALTALGPYQIIEASDGVDAIERMGDATKKLGQAAAGTDLMEKPSGASRIDCIISDINMLPMNGLEFLKAIRVGLAPIPRNTPVIMFTGHAERHFLATAIALDASGFLVKPVSANAFQERIERAVAAPITPRDASTYATLIVPDIESKDLWSSTAAMKQPGRAPVRAVDLANPGRTQLPLAVAPGELQIGDRLAEDLMTDDGVLVVPGGSRVAPALLAAIHDLAEVVKLPPAVTVFRT
jgi:CheY-like chemotaxis protein